MLGTGDTRFCLIFEFLRCQSFASFSDENENFRGFTTEVPISYFDAYNFRSCFTVQVFHQQSLQTITEIRFIPKLPDKRRKL